MPDGEDLTIQRLVPEGDQMMGFLWTGTMVGVYTIRKRDLNGNAIRPWCVFFE